MSKFNNLGSYSGKEDAEKTDRTFSCDLCEFVSETSYRLWIHKKKIHQKWLQCDQCEYTHFLAAMIKKHHEMVHLKLKKYHCDQCDYSGSQTAHLSTHKKLKHDAKCITYLCDECGYKTKLKGSLKGHCLTQFT